MAGISPATASRELGNLFDSGSLTGLNDRELIDRFRDRGGDASEAAFALLVARHGPMVQRVCRNVLDRQEDVEDAVQATFLVLVRQSRSIRKLDTLASWLYGVASRVAARARVEAARRRRSERHPIRLAAAIATSADPHDELERAAFGPIIQEEVRRLPANYREVVLLCYWEGLTQEQAAHRLGCPIGTVRSRVARARDLLRRRLERRGLAPATLFAEASGLRGSVPLSLVPAPLLHACAGSAMRVLSGGLGPPVVSANVSTLVHRVLRSLTMLKWTRMLIPWLVSVPLILAGATLAQRPAERPREPEKTVREQPATARRSVPPKNLADLVHVIEPPDLIHVEVLEALPGRPITGERLVRPDGKISLGFYGDVDVAGLTVREAKEKIVLHLKSFLNDDVLGLEEVDRPGKPAGKIKPADSDRVFVEVTAYNSRFYYVQGLVASPGRFPFTGNERVLDALGLAGGVLARGPGTKVKLMRRFPKGEPLRVLPVDYEEITVGTDDSTNYEILPYDRLVVTSDRPEQAASAPEPAVPSRPAPSPPGRPAAAHFDRTTEADGSERQHPSLQDINRRLDEMERKLDAILKKLGR